ncbi:hypothetical protein UCDDA912_g07879 [Diaporthe ampelina]|uniref:Uncharacterized protein n=1 Tax=Diaporthe ampelina TaxID=1214573 RepID=A0A0G2HVT7_9PEZI|nr:hypothetical protein UCDDA912_g07879 [Diaporthe ampelina]
MDSTPVKRNANRTRPFANPNFKPLWEPDTAMGRNAIRGLFHDDRASMDLVWQDRDDGALVAGENIVAVSKDGREDLRG